MTKQAKAPKTTASVTLAAPMALDSALALGGFVATVVVRREDGQPMTGNDRREAAKLIAASDESGRTDAEIDALASAVESRLGSSRSSRKPAPKGATKRQHSRARASKKKPAAPSGTTTTRSVGRSR